MKKLKVFIAYFPVLLVSAQILVNALYFLDRDLYFKLGFYLNMLVGTNILFALFLMAFTFTFRFCSISRWAAVAEVLFAANYMIVQHDNTYNIVFQVTVGLIALLITFNHYVKMFPLCRVSLLVQFWRQVFANKSCKKGFIEWEKEMNQNVINTPQLWKQKTHLN